MRKPHLPVRVLAGAIAFLVLAGVIAFVALFLSRDRAEAVTYKINYGTSLSCAGVDGTCGTVDDSCYCTPSDVGQAYNPGATADMKTVFAIPDPSPAAAHSAFSKIYTFGVPVSFWVALDSDIGNGAWVGNLAARATLSLLNQPCTTPYNLNVVIPLFDCTTDITDTITWDNATSGANLVADVSPANGLPDGCDHYPVHALLDPDGPWVDTNGDSMCAPPETGCKPPLMPRARYYGYTNTVPDAPPTQINFVYYNPAQLTLLTSKPDNDMGDSLGFPNFVIMDNPGSPAVPSPISDFCTPLDTTTSMLGLTAGEGKAIAKAGAQAEFSAMCTGANVGVDNDGDTVVDDGCFVVTDKCRDGIDNDGDTKVDELCDLVRQMNATVPGVYNTGSHMADAYSASYRDYDGDGVSNQLDGCPCRDAGGDGAPDPDGDGDGIPDVCDPTPGAANADQDGDGFQNRQDNCPLHPNGVPNQIDTDQDGIGDACEGTNDAPGNPGIWQCGGTSATVANGLYTNDMTVGAVCIGETDSDGDGWCDSTETLLGSDPNVKAKTPEFKGIDYKITAADTPPGEAPQTCTNWDYYDTKQNHPADPAAQGAGNRVDDNQAGGANGTGPSPDANCTNPKAYDKTRSEDGCGANTCGDKMDNGAACDGTGTDGADAADPDCWATGLSDKDVDGISDGSDNCPGTARGKDANPAQLNTDANGAMPGDEDASGDACDVDADNDGALNPAEWGHGTDPKSRNGRSPFDLNLDWKVSILDVLLYKPKLPPAHYDYDYDFNLDGAVSILDVLLYKTVLGEIEVDKYDVGVLLSGPGVTQRPDGAYQVTIPVCSNIDFTATSRESNRSPDTVPAGKAVVYFHCDAQAAPPAANHSQIRCGWLAQVGDIETTRDRFDPVCREDYLYPAQAYLLPSSFCKSAVSEQVWGYSSDAKQPGDGQNFIAESSLTFFSNQSEPYNTPRDFTRNFELHCYQPGTYHVRIYNKVLPRGSDGDGWTERYPWDNESRAVLYVTCS